LYCACTTEVCLAYSAWLRCDACWASAHVVDGLDLQRVDDEPDLGHLRLGAVEHLGGQLLPLGDDFLDGHRADDRAQVTGEDPPGQHRHLVLVGEEALARVDDALLVVADLERDHRPDAHRNPLAGDAGLLDLGLAHGQCEQPNPAQKRVHEGAVPDQDPERRPAAGASAAGNQHGLVGRWNSVTEHPISP
jgi:hypothetical protein